MAAILPSPSAAQPARAVSLESLNRTLAGKAALAFAASLFVALCAHAIVPLPFTPVPVTLSDLAVVLVGLVLGPVTGFMALAMYLLEGATGMPVFSPSGPGGLAQLLGPTGGYLMAYPFAAAAAGALFQVLKRPANFIAAFVSALTGSAILMTSGVVWLGFVLHLHSAQAFRLGALPFLPGQAVKLLVAAGIVTSLRQLQRTRKA